MRKRLILAGLTSAAMCSIALSATAPATAAPATSGETHVQTAVNTASTAELDKYWTPKRMANAKPMPAPDISQSSQPTHDTGSQLTVPGTAADTVASKGVEQTEGRLFFSTNDGDYICSATVIAGENKSTIATARHCGFQDDGTNYRFAPNYNAGNTPFGWFDWKSAKWVNGGDGITNDFAFIALNTQDGTPVTDKVGSTGIAFNQDIDRDINIVGIPGDTDTITHCTGGAYAGPAGQQLLDNCNGMSGGASGGAWVADYKDDGSGTQVGTFFGSYGDAAAGSYFGDDAYNTWNAIQTE